jgi:small subunit ribosomal protein S9
VGFFRGGTLSSTGTPIAGKASWFLGTGRRKESVARVFLRPGTGKITVNGRSIEQYFPNFAWKHDAIEPLKFTNIADQVDVVVTANGGGVGGQAGAVRMGLSRAISRFNPELRPALRKNGFLTRDSRMKERKKYGQKGARKRFQFTKR